MGQRGPAPAPARLKILRGEDHKDRIEAAPQPQDPPTMPADLSPAAQVIWRDTLEAIADTRHIGQPHAITFRRFCETAARANEREPGSREWLDLVATQLRLARELCLTPATSTNLHRAVKKDDRAARFLAG